MDDIYRKPAICPVEKFVETARKAGFLVDALPELSEGQTEVKGRCATSDREDKTNAQYRFWVLGDKSVYYWYLYNHRTQEVLFLASGRVPDGRSPKKLDAYERHLAEIAEDKRKLDEEERARIAAEWATFPKFELGDNVPYLEKKGLRPTNSFRRDDDVLKVAFRDIASGGITTIQSINSDGTKRVSEDRPAKNIFCEFPGAIEVPYVLIAEGVATALACWYSTHATTFSAYNCENLSAVAKYVRGRFPEKQIIVCADNDAKTEKETGRNPGLEAARDARRCGCMLAKPTKPDLAVNYDFSDMYLESGPSGVLWAVELARQAGANVMPSGYVERDDGLYQVVYRQTGQVALPEYHRLGPWLRVVGMASDAGSNFGKVVEWPSPNGATRRDILMFSDINSRRNERLDNLFSSYEAVPSKIAQILDYLAESSSTRAYEIVTQHGWHGDMYAASESEVIGDYLQTKMPRFRSRPADYGQQGSLDDWKVNVAEPTRGNPILTLALCVGFDGTLHRPACLEPGGLHLIGDSSIGKSTALKVAQSVWSSQAGMSTWRSTDNALETVAAAHNDCLLTLDEMGQSDERVVGQAVYMLFNGQGKARSRYRDATLQAADPLRWNFSVLSTGEETIEDKLASAGQSFKAGQDVRLANIPVTAEDFRKPDADSAALVEEVDDATRGYYGTAGPEFVRHLVANLPWLRENLPRMTQEIAYEHLCGDMPGCDGQVKRVAKRFALYMIAGVFAVKFGVLPHTQGEIIDAATSSFKRWVEFRGGAGALEAQRYIDIITNDFLSHEARYIFNGYDQVDCPSTEYPVRWPDDVHGYIDRREGKEGVYIPPSIFGKMMGGAKVNPKQAVESLKRSGYLLPDPGCDRSDQTRYSVYWMNGLRVTGDRRIYCYRLRLPENIDWETREAELNASTVTEQATVAESYTPIFEI